jgi:hypothetical protein
MLAMHQGGTPALATSRRGEAGRRATPVGLVVVLGLVLFRSGSLAADPLERFRPDPRKASTSHAAREDAVKSIPFDKLDAESRAKVVSVLRDVSFFRRMPVQVVPCDPDLFLFLVRHPDVIVNIWQVMGVTRIEMQETGPNTFHVVDPAGTKGSAEYLYSDHETQLIYSEGAYEGPLFTRPARGRCLMVLKTAYVREPDGRYYITTRVDVFMRMENIGVDLLTKAFSPLVGKVADLNLAYTAGFFASFSRAAEKNPQGARRLADKLSTVRPEVRERLAQLAEQAAEKAAELAEPDAAEQPRVASRTAEPKTP